MSEVGIALLGLGRAGSFHLESIRALPEARLRRVYDVDLEKANRFAEQAGCDAARDVEEALAPGVDCVLVATPTQTHREYVEAALGAGVAVLSEKPLGVDLAEIDRCFDLAEQKGLPLFVAFQRRFDPTFAEVISGVHAGSVGQLQLIRSVSRDNPVPSLEYLRTSGGIFHDMLVHDFDLICQVAGDVPEEVFSFGSSFLPEVGALGDIDTVAVCVRFASGVLATIDASRKSVYGYDQRLEVFGSGGMLQAENRPRTAVVRAGEEGLARPPVDHSFPTRYRDAYREELACFLACVRGDREVPVTREDVIANHLLACAAEQSFRERRPVRLDESKTPAPARG